MLPYFLTPFSFLPPTLNNPPPPHLQLPPRKALPNLIQRPQIHPIPPNTHVLPRFIESVLQRRFKFHELLEDGLGTVEWCRVRDLGDAIDGEVEGEGVGGGFVCYLGRGVD